MKWLILLQFFFRLNNVFDSYLGDAAYGSKLKSFNWVKDDIVDPVFVIETESGIKVCCPAQIC
jgi:hypothetical protein